MEKQPVRTAIVIDDHPDVLSLFVELLEIKNFQVVATGNNGAQGVELYKKFKPDITFLDVVMPNTDGFYALERIREIDTNAIIIMVTTDLSENTSRRLKDLRASSIVYKPFTIDDLVKIVSEIESTTNLNRTNFFN
jgi:two-component system, chemotaxis family, chemotaxis protein CheY